jgi:diaminopimelate decarboxylase
LAQAYGSLPFSLRETGISTPKVSFGGGFAINYDATAFINIETSSR